mmetsp:Transcript_5667/g.6147  ORF Transcript_5667/g.6147 Transcript_5667/m.6147 type:complete len:368 (+) Transcript_5667:163-1266(+)|eukprot:CAMPEP_0168526128 /NCGR_PEP_ID=MMETSP0405-20121227/11764_1 /TAXON_ID=498012 /ORGANISM="Trichosphaerium sp, Strain Am-I-7 wt" /LENGTH=367 /DNA_ID=CAMNT_0008548873 /DNA_START=85 /DNA_END=1188 /DNA_ORIENTATION=-
MEEENFFFDTMDVESFGVGPDKPYKPRKQKRRKPALPKVQRTEEEWATIFERYPTTEDGYVQSFAPEEPEKYLPCLKKYGIVVIRVLNAQECLDSQTALFEDANSSAPRQHVKLDQHDPNTWEPENWPSRRKFLLSRLALHPIAFRNRFHPNVYRVFCNIYKRQDLWTSIDNWGVMRGTKNLKFKDPDTGEIVTKDRDEWRYNLKLHWDLNPWKYYTETTTGGHMEQYQAIIAIADCPEEVGGHLTVPGSTRFLRQWCAENRKPHNKTILIRVPDGDKMLEYTQRIPLRAGEMVIWNSGQAHANFPNMSDKLRLTQFVRMMPALQQSQDRDRFAPKRVMRGKLYEDVDLSEYNFDEFGQKLVGLKEW